MLSTVTGELMYTLHVLHGELEKKIEAELTLTEGISLSQYMVLVGFSSSKEPLSQSQLAVRLRLTEATISRHIGILITKKLLERKKDKSNQKSYMVSLTPLGNDLFIQTEARILELVEGYFSVLTVKDKENITKQLKKVLPLLQK